jgi:hypothetical protein
MQIRVCISTVTSSAIDVCRMGKQLEAMNIPVVIGGAHPPFLRHEALGYAGFANPNCSAFRKNSPLRLSDSEQIQWRCAVNINGKCQPLRKVRGTK